MYVGMVNRFAYVSTAVTRDMKPVEIGPLVKTDSRNVVMLMNTALWLGVYP